VLRAFKKAGLNAQRARGVLVHGFRHTFAIELANADVSLDFSCRLAGSRGGGAGWLVGLIVVGGYDGSPGVAPVGRAFLGPVGSFVLSGQGQESRC
jgi:hypothetical protein